MSNLFSSERASLSVVSGYLSHYFSCAVADPNTLFKTPNFITFPEIVFFIEKRKILLNFLVSVSEDKRAKECVLILFIEKY